MPTHRDGTPKYRPTVAIVLQKGLFIARMEIFHQESEADLLEKTIRDIKRLSPETEVVPRKFRHQNRWDYNEVLLEWYEFASRYPFDITRERYLVSMATGTHVETNSLFVLTKSHYIPGELLQMIPPSKEVPNDFAGSHKIVDVDLSAYFSLIAVSNKEQQEATTFLKSGIATRNKAFNELIDEIEQVVTARSSPVLRVRTLQKKGGLKIAKGGPPAVLLAGATGVGKSQLARRIYELKRERKLLEGDFIEVNCATLRGAHAMSALFGHVKGAFTDARESRTGYLRSADGGILFLDEIGELGLDEQAMLLRAIEEKKFQPVGSDVDVESNFQLIAGTNRDLEAEVVSGRFREDLLARINLWSFALPPLARRREDIEPNIDHELRQYELHYQTKIVFNKDAEKRFLHFAVSPEALWLANFRDLNAAIVRMATLSPGGRIRAEIVEKEIVRLERQWKKISQEPRGDAVDLLGQYFDDEQVERIDRFDQTQLAEVIRVCRESKSLSDAGRRLYQFSRTQKGSLNDASRLRKYLERFGLNWKDVNEK